MSRHPVAATPWRMRAITLADDAARAAERIVDEREALRRAVLAAETILQELRPMLTECRETGYIEDDTKPAPCPTCGDHPDHDPSECNVEIVQAGRSHHTSGEPYADVESPCPRCNGRGEHAVYVGPYRAGRDECQRCGGSGRIETQFDGDDAMQWVLRYEALEAGGKAAE